MRAHRVAHTFPAEGRCIVAAGVLNGSGHIGIAAIRITDRHGLTRRHR